MDDPHDDTDVPSGTTDGAQMERTLPPVRLETAAAAAGATVATAAAPALAT